MNDRSNRPRQSADAGERIAKRLARVGLASRREAESMIAAGRVRVNGKILQSPAFNVVASDRIELDGHPIPTAERTRLFLFHKPPGCVTTNRDPQGRKTVFDILPGNVPRVLTVGRLDINTEGLLLLTNDGGLARVLELPSTGWLRKYRVRVHGKVRQSELDGLKDGIAVDGVFYGSVEAALDREQGSNAWLTIGLREGKNREIKNILGKLGLEVSRLIRISYGPFQLGDLAPGAVQELKGRTLREQLGHRLIAESGADFDAPLNPRDPDTIVAAPESDKRRPARRRGPAPGKKTDRAASPSMPRSRASNVWMAPGARPKASKSGNTEERRDGGRSKGQRAKPADRKPRRPGSGRNADRRR